MSAAAMPVQNALSSRARDLLKELYRLIERENGHAPSASEFFPIAVEKLVTRVLGWELESVDLVGAQFSLRGDYIGPNHGETDYAERRIRVSRGRGGDPELRFTIAHEVGHVVLHANTLVRANRTRSLRPVDRRAAMSPEPLQQRLEREADVFAAALLMPERGVRDRFKELFGAERLLVNSQSTTALRSRVGWPNLTVYAFELAQRRVQPNEKTLSEFFGVSPTAMAIRVCELRLVQ